MRWTTSRGQLLLSIFTRSIIPPHFLCGFDTAFSAPVQLPLQPLPESSGTLPSHRDNNSCKRECCLQAVGALPELPDHRRHCFSAELHLDVGHGQPNIIRVIQRLSTPASSIFVSIVMFQSFSLQTLGVLAVLNETGQLVVFPIAGFSDYRTMGPTGVIYKHEGPLFHQSSFIFIFFLLSPPLPLLGLHLSSSRYVRCKRCSCCEASHRAYSGGTYRGYSGALFIFFVLW